MPVLHLVIVKDDDEWAVYSDHTDILDAHESASNATLEYDEVKLQTITII
tara:strand:+ start:108 stop:257 length:150 start_codon:yes stop_codon:yes gene_type:complete